MFNRDIFSKRIKCLRKSYKLTLVEFSDCCQFMSKATIGFWEKGTAVPSVDVLAKLSTFFGISMDWFAGLSNIPYTKESIENAEKYVFKQIALVDQTNFYLKIFPDEYLDNKKRETFYSLSVRANIIVLLHAFYITHVLNGRVFCPEVFLKGYLDTPKENRKDFYISRFALHPNPIKADKIESFSQNLVNLLTRKITTPIYDIESSDLK